MFPIVPTILTPSKEEALNKLTKLRKITNQVHLDVIDSSFSDQPTIDFHQFNTIKLVKKFQASFHLMVKNPTEIISKEKTILAKTIIGQVEMIKNQSAFVKKLLALKIKPGLACDWQTSFKKIKPEILSNLEIILIMMVKAGVGGQSLQISRLDQVRQLNKLRRRKGFSFKICVDGGVNLRTIKACRQAGADIFAVGSAVWKNKNIGRAISALQLAINS